MGLVKKNSISRFPSVFDDFLNTDWLGGIEHKNFNTPAVNIIESDSDFSIQLSAPGRKKEDFEIEVNENILTISSETESAKDEKDLKGTYTRREFKYNSFKRAFELPETVNEDKIDASYLNGILMITLPKTEQALPKPKRVIEIS